MQIKTCVHSPSRLHQDTSSCRLEFQVVNRRDRADSHIVGRGRHGRKVPTVDIAPAVRSKRRPPNGGGISLTLEPARRGARKRRMICGHPPSPITGAHSRGDPPGDGRRQNEACRNNCRNPEAGVSAQRRPRQHNNDAYTEQNAICHQIDQYGNLRTCRGFPSHRQPFPSGVFSLWRNSKSCPAQWFQNVRPLTSPRIRKMVVLHDRTASRRAVFEADQELLA